MKEWRVYIKNGKEFTVWTESYEKWWHGESSVWYWKFSDGSIFQCQDVGAIVNESKEAEEKK